jgi:hypothetical protein
MSVAVVRGAGTGVAGAAGGAVAQPTSSKLHTNATLRTAATRTVRPELREMA